MFLAISQIKLNSHCFIISVLVSFSFRVNWLAPEQRHASKSVLYGLNSGIQQLFIVKKAKRSWSCVIILSSPLLLLLLQTVSLHYGAIVIPTGPNSRGLMPFQCVIKDSMSAVQEQGGWSVTKPFCVKSDAQRIHQVVFFEWQQGHVVITLHCCYVFVCLILCYITGQQAYPEHTV